MILEYLFLDQKNKGKIENIHFVYEIKNKGNITQTIKPIASYTNFDKSDVWVVKYEVKGDNLNNARCLSELNAKITSKYNPTVLKNDASAYFNEHLYPLFNKFERVLRQLLYIKNALYSDDKVKKVIENLEGKDFGEIYNLLFIDDDFCKAAKEIANAKEKGKSGLYTKEDLIKQLSGIDEDTTWDKVIGSSKLNGVKSQFSEVKSYRNDVMHAHNIDYNTYKRAKKILTQAIKSLEEEIAQCIKYPDTQEKAEFVVDTLYDRLEAAHRGAVKIGEGFVALINLMQKISNIVVSEEEKRLIEQMLDADKPSEEEDTDGEYTETGEI